LARIEYEIRQLRRAGKDDIHVDRRVDGNLHRMGLDRKRSWSMSVGWKDKDNKEV